MRVDGAACVRLRRIISRRCESIRTTTGNLRLIRTPKFFEPIRALQLANALAPYDPLFYEEPLPPREQRCVGALAFPKCGFRWRRVNPCTRSLNFWICCRSTGRISSSQMFVSAGIVGDAKDRCDSTSPLRDGGAAQPDGPLATAVKVHLPPRPPISKFWNITCPMKPMP